MATIMEVKMRAVLEIALAIIFSLSSISFGKNIYQEIKKESLLKVQSGLSPLESFTKRMTSKN
tara:strand:- start:238 stop:426 length:189 start_codon:yes stop_codon:yes gene_type:complete